MESQTVDFLLEDCDLLLVLGDLGFEHVDLLLIHNGFLLEDGCFLGEGLLQLGVEVGDVGLVVVMLLLEPHDLLSQNCDFLVRLL